MTSRYIIKNSTGREIERSELGFEINASTEFHGVASDLSRHVSRMHYPLEVILIHKGGEARVRLDHKPFKPNKSGEAPKSANYDNFYHPKHYTQHPSGVECIEITEHMNFNLGNAVKYIWRADIKHDSPLEDLQKAKFYVEREIARISKNNDR